MVTVPEWYREFAPEGIEKYFSAISEEMKATIADRIEGLVDAVNNLPTLSGTPYVDGEVAIDAKLATLLMFIPLVHDAERDNHDEILTDGVIDNVKTAEHAMEWLTRLPAELRKRH